jgi:uncharacterized membrane protein
VDTRLRVSGHLVQPMLVACPLGLFASAAAFDLSKLLGAPPLLGDVGYHIALGGLVAATLTAVAETIDLWDAPADGTRRAAVMFLVVNLGMSALFLLGCVARSTRPAHLASAALLGLELAALAVGAAGVWLGVRLGQRFDQAHAPEPAPDAGFALWREARD